MYSGRSFEKDDQTKPSLTAISRIGEVPEKGENPDWTTWPGSHIEDP